MKDSNIILHALTSLRIKKQKRSSIHDLLNDRAQKIKTKSLRHISGKKEKEVL